MPDELDALRDASSGLLYPSETDAPFEVFTWPAAASVKDAVVAHGKAKGKIEEISLDEFFDELRDADVAAKFANLRQAVSSTLSDAKVYRVGEINVDVYVVGETKSGTIGGLHTTSVET